MEWRQLGCNGPGQQFVDAVDWVIGDATQHVAEVRLWVEVIEPGCADERVHRRGPFFATVRTSEEIVLAT